jgi:hypothetical protein
MASPTAIQLAEKYLYEKADDIPEKYREHMLRLRVGHSFWYEQPSRTRNQVKQHICSLFDVSAQQAYNDIILIEQIMGSIQSPSKEWVRFRVNSMLEEAFSRAEKMNDPKAMAMIADKMGKYNMLDQVDPEKTPFDQIVPQNFEPTEDPSVLGITRDPNIREKKQKMIEKYAADIEVIDIPYTEMPDDDEGEEKSLLQ